MNLCVVRHVSTLLLSICLPLVASAQQAGSSRGEASERTETEAGPSASTGSTVDYVLQPQDVLRVQVFQEEDINRQGEVSISSEFTITLPLIGTINLRGVTVRQAEEKIRALYDKDFLVNPQVTVIVTKYSDRSVNIVGSVKSAGRVQFPQERGLTIMEAISLAGGHDRLADLKRVKLTRKGETREINVDAIMKGNSREAQETIELEPGDVVFVPERII
jgi:polysaccharide export outer membrane protein